MRHDDGTGDPHEASPQPTVLARETRSRRHWLAWSLAAVPVVVIVVLPLLAGLLLALVGLASDDFEWGSEDGPDSAATTLAEGQRTTQDLTADVMAALTVEGRSDVEVVCPATPQHGAPTSVRCSGSVDAWEHVAVNLHEGGRFTVVGAVNSARTPS